MASKLLVAGLAAAALVLVLLVALQQYLSPQPYEVNYSISYIFTTPSGRQALDLGWMVVGVGPQNYSVAVLRFGGVEIQLYDATEGGKSYEAICAMGRCIANPSRSVELPVDFKSVAVSTAGVCRHLGREGALMKASGVPELGLLAEVAKAHGVSLNATADAEVCESKGVVLWLRAGYTFRVGGRDVKIEIVMNATRLGPYNATRHREALQKAKSAQQR
ncbi:hypothetical protein [Pyrobaculum sp.]|uniref:hypothetical protein n=1 Tax=Pyrobaculum sp. TaxID=2004705 RepID=UPI003D0A7BD2